tara:strand:+ start:717 stop:887 length:171 start_codon:yes stop_codon:yes gene_type:complete
MATGRVTKKVLDYISKINNENKEKILGKLLKKEVKINANGSSRYKIKEGKNKGKIV